MTNLERLQSMSAEEMADTINKHVVDLDFACQGEIDDNDNVICPYENCTECIKHWLEEQVDSSLLHEGGEQDGIYK